MKNKIKEALKQEYKNLGLSDEAFEGVAAFGETFIKDEADIPNFVKGAEKTLKQIQSAGDKARTEAAQSKKDLEKVQQELDELKAKTVHKDGKDGEGGEGGEGNGGDDKDIAATITAAVAAAIKPLQDKIEAFEGERSAKVVANKAKADFEANDYVKAYKDEASDAWERVMEMNEATGSKMTAEQIKEKVMGYFNKAVQRKGVDTAKPFKSEGEGGAERDWSAERKRQEARAGIVSEEK